jgi:hypothetical protein
MKMSERQAVKIATVPVESEGHVSGAPETNSSEDKGQLAGEVPAKNAKNGKTEKP